MGLRLVFLLLYDDENGKIAFFLFLLPFVAPRARVCGRARMCETLMCVFVFLALIFNTSVRKDFDEMFFSLGRMFVIITQKEYDC